MIGALTGMLAACAGGIAACSGSEPTLNNDDYTFTNPDTPTAECDEGMTIDGVLDEAIYNEEGRTWLELSKREGDGLGTAEVRMTTAYGEKGLYVVFDVDESNHIWVNPNRDIYINSGIEMYLAVEGVTHIDDRGSFEINLCSDGSLSVKMGEGAELGGRGVVNTTYDKMPVLGTQTKNGAVNSNTCTGYTLEFFIPYVFTDYLGLERSSLENLYINPVLISSLDYETTDYTMGREWFSFGEHKLDGYEWGNPSHSYPFGENGAKTHAVTIENTSSAGTIAEVNGYDYAVDGHSASFVVNEGDSRLTGLYVNGEDITSSIRYDADGYAIGFTVGNVTEDLAISATFTELPTTPVNVRVNGTTVSGASVELENGTLSFDSAEYLPGMPIEMTIKADEDCGFKSLRINGEDRTADVENGTSIFLPRYFDETLEIELEIERYTPVELSSGTIKAYDAQGAASSAPEEGTEIGFVFDAFIDRSYTATVGADGTFTVDGEMFVGDYFVTCDGYVTDFATLDENGNMTLYLLENFASAKRNASAVSLGAEKTVQNGEATFVKSIEVGGRASLSPMNPAEATLDLSAAERGSTKIEVEFTVQLSWEFGDGNSWRVFGVTMAGDRGFSVGWNNNAWWGESGTSVIAFGSQSQNVIPTADDGNVNAQLAWMMPLVKGDGIRMRAVRTGTDITLWAKNGENWEQIGSTTCESSDMTELGFWSAYDCWRFSDFVVTNNEQAEQGERVSVGAVSVSAHGLDGARSLAAGTQITLEYLGEPAGEYTVTVGADGAAQIDSDTVYTGRYAVSCSGYMDTTVTVTEDGNVTVALNAEFAQGARHPEYTSSQVNRVENGYSYSIALGSATVGMNGPTDPASASLILSAATAASDSVTLEVTVKQINDISNSASWRVFGITMAENAEAGAYYGLALGWNNGPWDTNGGTEVMAFGSQADNLLPSASGSGANSELSWMTPLVKADGAGVRLRFVREGAAITAYALNGTEWVKIGETQCAADADTTISFWSAYNYWSFSDITVTNNSAE